MSNKDGQKIDFASVFPAKGDSRRPPDWWGRALLYAAIAVFLSIFVWNSFSKISYILLDIVISIFIALAIEPVVTNLVRHGWKRGAASAIALVGLFILAVAMFGLFGNLFVQQVISMVKNVPQLYEQLASTIKDQTNFKLPAMENLGGEILKNIQTSWVTDFAGQALSTTMGFFSFLLNLLTVIMVTYYISAAGPKLRRSVCQWMSPGAQRRFLLAWTIVQDQISGFLFSRTILAIINATCTSIFLVIINVPYWLPLALFCGVVSQFIPTVGTYIGGALPIIFAWGSDGVLYAVAVLVFIIVYQQIENLVFAPKISQRTMDLNPAIAFLSVLVLGAIFGALGAFLALPVTASLQVLFKVYTKRYELVDSPLMSDPAPVKKSKVVEGAEAFNEHVIKPVSDRMPRAARGSSARVPIDNEMRKLQEEIYSMPSGEVGDEGETMAIPKGILQPNRDRVHLKGLESDSGSDTEPPSDELHELDHSNASNPKQPQSFDSQHHRMNRKLNTLDDLLVQEERGTSASKSDGDQADDNPRSRWH
jgi:predicted PurR-regulated permease PerM